MEGVLVTIGLTVATMLIGLVLGSVLALARISRNPAPLRRPSRWAQRWPSPPDVLSAIGAFGHRPAPWSAAHHDYFIRHFGHSFGACAIGDDLPQPGNRVTPSGQRWRMAMIDLPFFPVSTPDAFTSCWSRPGRRTIRARSGLA